MTRWYRAYEGTVTDAKLGEVALVAGCSRSVAIAAWHCILESAATANSGGVFDATPRRIAVILGEQPALIEAVFNELTALGMVTEGKVTAWSKRQYESDSSTERSKKFRERAKQPPQQQCNADATLQKQHATPPETETETETDITTHHAQGADDWGQLEAKCRQAAGWEREPSPNLFVIGPIAALRDAGCSLELDILPTIKARSPSCRGSKSWKYFISAIQQARDDRLGAMTPANPSKPFEARHGNPAKRNSISDSFAVVDAALAAERNRIEALEREFAGAGNSPAIGGEGLKLVS